MHGRRLGLIDWRLAEPLPNAWRAGPHTTAHEERRPEIEKEEPIEMEGTVVEVLGNANFKVRVHENHDVLARLAGKMRKFRIRVLPGDRVTLEVSPYDLTRGRITYRHRK